MGMLIVVQKKVVGYSYINISGKTGKIERSGEISAIARLILPGLLCVLRGVGIELLLAARGTEVIFHSFVLAREFGCLLIHRHLTDWINRHTTPQIYLPFFASGINVLSRSESVTTVTELAAIASAASSGLNIIPNEG